MTTTEAASDKASVRNAAIRVGAAISIVVIVVAMMSWLSDGVAGTPRRRDEALERIHERAADLHRLVPGGQDQGCLPDGSLLLCGGTIVATNGDDRLEVFSDGKWRIDGPWQNDDIDKRLVAIEAKLKADGGVTDDEKKSARIDAFRRSAQHSHE